MRGLSVVCKLFHNYLFPPICSLPFYSGQIFFLKMTNFASIQVLGEEVTGTQQNCEEYMAVCIDGVKQPSKVNTDSFFSEFGYRCDYYGITKLGVPKPINPFEALQLAESEWFFGPRDTPIPVRLPILM